MSDVVEGHRSKEILGMAGGGGGYGGSCLAKEGNTALVGTESSFLRNPK